MSIKIMAQVWENGPADRTELLVLLALSDFANDQGKAWPAMKSIAKKSRLSSERAAQKIVRRLEEKGWVSIATGGGRSGCNEYVINPVPLFGVIGGETPSQGSGLREINPVPGDAPVPGTPPSQDALNPVPGDGRTVRTVNNTPLSPQGGHERRKSGVSDEVRKLAGLK